MDKAIRRSGVEANGAVALQSGEASGPVCQQKVKKLKKTNIFTINLASVASGHAWSHHPSQ